MCYKFVSLRRRPESICSWVCWKSVNPRDGLENSALSTHTNTYTPWLIQCPYNLNASASVVVMRLLFLILYWILFVLSTDRPTDKPQPYDERQLTWLSVPCRIVQRVAVVVGCHFSCNEWMVCCLVTFWLNALRHFMNWNLATNPSKHTCIYLSLVSLHSPPLAFFVVILIVAYTHTHSERKSSSQIQM